MNCNFLFAILILLVECQIGALAAPSQATHSSTATTFSTAEPPTSTKPTKPNPQQPPTTTTTPQPIDIDPNGDSSSGEHPTLGIKQRDSNVEKLKRGLTSFISKKNPATYFVPIRSVYSDQVRLIQQQAAKINLDSDKTELIKLNDESPLSPTSGHSQQERDQEQQSLQAATEPPQQITGTQLMAEPSSLVNSGEGAINIPPRLVQTRPIGFVLRWGRK